ncbi:hypothetical protein [Lacrimispora saccharolytica]|uniref:Uncharacterized protein n=1 Tax=Lacrimispora saccharolytica (strain ATCC 35040 / DSM 2544 / NRCC 2533 / WM1) TaxID=610130 RepID=D9R1U4_LACSW|nr:hypothetical protein [Lacrimispora saccharolytica]ADL02835.1 hypothetical protein Closa_0192 [[Clostridium] saccharolyticum WM1]QRV18960.1 hypothetical protein I6K70_15915 [Lacrimispora saccharolytica]
MQEDLKNELKRNGFDIEVWDEEKMKIYDSDRIIVIAFLNDYSITETDRINNEVMEKVRQLQIEAEEEKLEKYDNFSIRQILWDVYILFVLTNKEKYASEEQIFMLQRDKKYSKKYLIQGNNIDELSNIILNILRPEQYIDSVVRKIRYEYSDADNCNNICDAEQTGKEYVKKFNVKSCQDILNFLNKVNADEYGEIVDENC